MPSLASFEKLERLGLDLRSADAERFNLNDTLATSRDLENLFEVLSGIKDKNGVNATFTPISIVANPDFLKIKESNFLTYFYEPFTETMKRFPGCEKSFDRWKEGISEKLFMPQMHGREHLNVSVWMKDLQAGEEKTLFAFEEGVWGFVPTKYPEVDYQAAYKLADPVELEYQKGVINDGLQLFNKIFGYKAEYFVPPNGPFNNALNQTLVENGVKLRSVSKIQDESIGRGRKKKVFHYLGQKENNGIRYITRNCFFEPNQTGTDWVDSCLYDIKIAFRWDKPAIISSHRVNYVGALNQTNRDNGLRQLTVLLNEIIKKWPDVEFMTTPQLGELLNKE